MQHYVVRPKVDKSSGEEKIMYYGIPVTAGKVTEEQIAAEICERSSLTEADILGAIKALSRSINDHLADGKTVHLKDIGMFYVSATSEGSPTPEGCTPSKIKPNRVCFKADNSMRSVLARIKYQFTKRDKSRKYQ